MVKNKDNLNTTASQSFTYDALARLKSASGIFGNMDYSYSKNGNLTQIGSKELFYNDADHPHAVTYDSTGMVYEYDANGNMTMRGDSFLRYDSSDRLTSYTAFALIESYAYDFTGFRIRKTSAKGADLKITYNIGGLYEVLVRPGFPNEHTKYIYGIKGEIAAQISKTNSVLVTEIPPVVFDSSRFISNPGLYLQDFITGILANVAFEINNFLDDGKNRHDMMLVILLLLTIAALSVGAYYRIFRRQEIAFQLK